MILSLYQLLRPCVIASHPPLHPSNLDRTDFSGSAYQLLRPCVIASTSSRFLSLRSNALSRMLYQALMPLSIIPHSQALTSQVTALALIYQALIPLSIISSSPPFRSILGLNAT